MRENGDHTELNPLFVKDIENKQASLVKFLNITNAREGDIVKKNKKYSVQLLVTIMPKSAYKLSDLKLWISTINEVNSPDMKIKIVKREEVK